MKYYFQIMLFSTFLFFSKTYAHDLSIVYGKKTSNEQRQILDNVFTEISPLLPQEFKNQLPQNIELNFAKLSNHLTIPLNICSQTSLTNQNTSDKPFVYGSYSSLTNTLTLNMPLLYELKKGRDLSQKILCQHKTLYDQVIATIIHELTHAYDFNSHNISQTNEYLKKSDFKRSLFGIKNKNKAALRPADVYELQNSKESFAVNMEYFLLDSEFSCRKPSLFQFYKSLLNYDPFPNKTCEINYKIMVSNGGGMSPIKLDPKRVYRIDYLLAAPGKDLSSGFGHSMYRIILCAPKRLDPLTQKEIAATPFGPECLKDKLYHLVISYRANIEDSELNYLKGIFGGYPSKLFILNFSDVLDEYNRDELRDIISYPLNLNESEKSIFVTRTIEEYWNYNGAYKFFTNNCAVESFDLLSASLNLQKKSPYTPKGVLEELFEMNLIERNNVNIELFKTKIDSLTSAYSLAYDYRLTNKPSDKKAFFRFIDDSDSVKRKMYFDKFSIQKNSGENQSLNLHYLKMRVIKAASFSVIEQQIQRTKMSELKKKLASILNDSKNDSLLKLIKQRTTELKNENRINTISGYGIPFEDDFDNSAINSSEENSIVDIAASLKTLAQSEYNELELINKNIELFNKFSNLARKEFKLCLDSYIEKVIENLTLNEETTLLLQQASTGDADSLKKIRQLIGEDLVTKTEVLDTKLIKIIHNQLTKDNG